ncbi:hypothetical protein NDU88_001353 [Pleurodeles waltl]|uniref:Uncharacterized protein n=1 Tax=Pleurodeles waltl TaxID=8319 RepID=A0AAV7Q2V9_PLEWA|nr:hypothetical protein NDU88_001353 [Pleurodeles waltl]
MAAAYSHSTRRALPRLSTRAAQAVYSPRAAQAVYSPRAAQAVYSPRAAQAVYSPRAAQAVYSPRAAQAGAAPNENFDFTTSAREAGGADPLGVDKTGGSDTGAASQAAGTAGATKQIPSTSTAQYPLKHGVEKSGGSVQGQDDSGLPSESYKRDMQGHPHIVTRAAGLASQILLAVKQRIWHKVFIDILLLEIQIEGLDLTMCNKKEDDRRERAQVKKERNFNDWLDAFRIMACLIVEKFPHCAKDLWL